MSLKYASTSESLLDELQATLAHGTVARRVETLRRVTDLFINGAVDFSNEQIALFDDVFQCLILHIENSAKALLSNRLAPVDRAPPLTIRALAFDDVIEVAAPVLSQSQQLDDDILIETARSKSQAHLMAIATRKVLSGAVTDVLVLRGNDEVIHSTLNNPGAEFSERGFTRLVSRAEGDDDLATCIGLRPAMPRHLYLKLLAKASATVRARLEAANPPFAHEVSTAVLEATQIARSSPSAITQQTAIAHALVKSLFEDGRLDEHQVAAFAEAGKFDETLVGLVRDAMGIANQAQRDVTQVLQLADRETGAFGEVAGHAATLASTAVDIVRKVPGARELDRLLRGPIDMLTATAEQGEVQARAMRQNLEATAKALGLLTAVLERVNSASRSVNSVISPEA